MAWALIVIADSCTLFFLLVSSNTSIFYILFYFSTSILYLKHQFFHIIFSNGQISCSEVSTLFFHHLTSSAGRQICGVSLHAARAAYSNCGKSFTSSFFHNILYSTGRDNSLFFSLPYLFSPLFCSLLSCSLFCHLS